MVVDQLTDEYTDILNQQPLSNFAVTLSGDLQNWLVCPCKQQNKVYLQPRANEVIVYSI